MEKLVILDYNLCTIDIYNIECDVNVDEDYIRKLGHNSDECSWMFSEDIKINLH